MAEFSKEFLEIVPNGFEPDFSYKEEFEKLRKGQKLVIRVGLICEGIGSCAISIDSEDNELLWFNGKGLNEPYSVTLKETLQRIKREQK